MTTELLHNQVSISRSSYRPSTGTNDYERWKWKAGETRGAELLGDILINSDKPRKHESRQNCL